MTQNDYKCRKEKILKVLMNVAEFPAQIELAIPSPNIPKP